jgi:glutamyl-tRNA reductase
MGELAARYLLDHGAGKLLSANRTLERAEALASELGAEALALNDIPQQGHRADIVISCTGGSEPIIRRETVEAFLSRRKQRPILLLDIAVPRDIDPEVHKLENAFVYNVDDLQALVDTNLADRQRAAAKAEAIIDDEVEKFVTRLGTLDVVPTLQALQNEAERLRQQELTRIRARLGQLTPEQETAIDALTRGLMQKWLHRPLTEMKELARDSSLLPWLDMVQRLFGLKDRD